MRTEGAEFPLCAGFATSLLPPAHGLVEHLFLPSSAVDTTHTFLWHMVRRIGVGSAGVLVWLLFLKLSPCVIPARVPQITHLLESDLVGVWPFFYSSWYLWSLYILIFDYNLNCFIFVSKVCIILLSAWPAPHRSPALFSFFPITSVE